MSTVLLERAVLWPIQPNSILVAERWTLGGQARKARTFLCERKNAASSRVRRGQAAVGGGFCMSRNTQGAEEGREGDREGDTETDTWQSYHQPPLGRTINTNNGWRRQIFGILLDITSTGILFYFDSIQWVKEKHEIYFLDKNPNACLVLVLAVTISSSRSGCGQQTPGRTLQLLSRPPLPRASSC